MMTSEGRLLHEDWPDSGQLKQFLALPLAVFAEA
jgi:hypothetical protein